MKAASAAQVRTWLADNGGAGARGRLKAADYERFNKAHSKKGIRYTPESEAEKRHTVIEGVVGIDKAGRKVTKSVTVTCESVRTMLGIPLDQRGRLPKAQAAEHLSALNADAVAAQFN